MVHFVHPATDDITLTGILAALSDPMRLLIFKRLVDEKSCLSCSEATPCPEIAKSTLSNHFRILREAGLIRTTKRGVENRNVVRCEELDIKFPGLLATILRLSDDAAKKA